MAKIIAVTGATGTQGGGVVNVMKNVPGWKIRAVTRNPGSEAAQKLVAQGIEVVQANYDDEASLVKALEGVHAVFAVTNWWESLFAGRSQAESSEIETAQGMALARAAAATSTLEHYIWSTCPDTKETTGGRHTGVPHMDCKALVDRRIKQELPELAAKTTYMYLGYYPQNMFTFPFLKPIEFPVGSGTYIHLMPSPADSKILMAGDMTVNPGLWVRQILATGSATFGKYVNVALEKYTFQQAIQEWAEVMGKRGIYVPCTREKFTELWGVAGCEFALQLEFGTICDPWVVVEGKHLDPVKDLGIRKDEVVGFRGVMEQWKHTVV